MIIALLLALIGLLFVFEASVAQAQTRFNDAYFFVKQQSFWLAIGTISMFCSYLIPTSWWHKLSWPLFGVSILAMLAVFIPGVGITANGATRWISIGFTSLQPVEILKLGQILFFSSWLSQHQRILPFAASIFLMSILLLLQPDVGSLLLILCTAGTIYFVAGAEWKHMLGAGIVGGLLLAILIIMQPYRWQRVVTYLNPNLDPLGTGFHARQLTIALGNGGLFGQGIGRSTQKYSYVPEASTDSIFAIVAEEIGFLGSCFILAIFMLFFYIAIKHALKLEKTPHTQLLAIGITAWIGWQVILNIAAVVALVPLTGVPMPFFSYGGTALVMLLSATGILARSLTINKINKK